MVVPADWKELELSRVAEIGPGINKALSEMGTGSLYVTVEDIYSGSSLDIGRLGRISISRSEIERFSLQVGDLVLGKSSVKRDGIGYPNLFLGCAEPVVPSGFTYRVRPDKKVLSSTFLLQYLRSRPGRKWVIDNSQSSALTNINSSIINRYPVIVPPLKEQEAIAEALSDADTAIESLDALIAKKRDVKQATMQQLLTGRTRLPGFAADWKEVRLGECLTIMHGKNQSQIVDPEGRYPILATGGVIGRTNSYLSNKPSVLIGRKGTIDRPQYMDTPFWTVDTLFYSEVKNGNSAKFLFYKFLMVNWKKYNEASGVPSLNASTIENVEMMMPPLKEQEAIAEALTVMDDELEALTEQVSKLRMVKEGMMQDLLTGKVRLV